ncbi:stalk domain-containing protein [Fictibacillus sp. BK138]|uniref:stalk domain-containing protein n=1 Tax=Fictibacillus sp. BK138 TaxID=2512121 RepID=UPI00102A29BF|nr:stalk domain-containing protein [Fictibacillus sp. BK138]RZT21540.1 copper amine oxidase-like protein [Fictibacillus sp. BK138]
MKLHKKIISFGVGLTVCLTPLTSTHAVSSPISIFVNGAKQFYDQPAFIKENRTLVPMRGIAEDIGATVKYNAADQTVIMKDSKATVTLKIGSKNAYINGMKKLLDVPAEIKNNRTVVPLRFVGEAFGANMAYDHNTHRVYITNTLFKEIVQENKEKVVTIHKIKHGQRYLYRGAGVIVSPSLVLTTETAVHQAQGAVIEMSNGKEVTVEGVVELDKDKNLALLKLSSPVDVEPVRISNDFKAGEKAISLSAKEAVEIEIEDFSELIASKFYTITRFTNSLFGTPLFNYDGELIGLSVERDGDDSVEFFERAVGAQDWSSYFSMKHADIETSGFFEKLPSQPIETIGDISLGMDDTMVRSLEKGEFGEESYPYLVYKGENVLGPDGQTGYEFFPKERSLKSIEYHYASESMTKEEATQKYQELIQKLEAVHGGASEMDNNWEVEEDGYFEELHAEWYPEFNEEKPVILTSVQYNSTLKQYRFALYYLFYGSYRK